MPLRSRMPLTRPVPAAIMALAAAVATAAPACKQDGSAGSGKPVIADAAANTLRLAKQPSASAAAPRPSAAPSSSAEAAKTPKAPRPPTGPTADEVADEARAHVAEAIRHATDKDACATVLPLLDVSYSLVRGSTPVDERVLAVFADCAAEHHRWRLLRGLAEAIAAGERKLETTYFMPRALVGEGSYETANNLAKATLRAWPMEGEAYNTAALAALRVKDWDAAVKAADQALLLQRKHNVNNDVTALAHALRGAALLRIGKTDDGVHEVEAAKGHEGVLRGTDVTLEAAHVVKEHGFLATVDLPTHAYAALWPLYAKKVAPLAGFATVTLQNVSDHPLAVVVEVAVDGAETSAESETVLKGHPIALALTPALKAGSSLLGAKAEVHDVTVTVSGGVDHAPLYHETRKVTFEPATAMPKVIRAHGEDLRPAFALEAAWATPKAPSVAAVVDAAKARLHGARDFDGTKGRSLPQVQALWDEVRSRSVAFHRDPRVDTEAEESVACHLPTEILEAGSGSALESSVLFASLLEAIGLDVLLVATPGHRMVGWLGTAADVAATDNGPQTVKSPRGQAFFLETTTVGDGPFDAAVLRGDAEWVAATNDGSVTTGRADLEALSELRKRGVTPREP